MFQNMTRNFNKSCEILSETHVRAGYRNKRDSEGKLGEERDKFYTKPT